LGETRKEKGTPERGRGADVDLYSNRKYFLLDSFQVSGIVGRADVLAAFFVLTSFLSYHR